MIYVQLGFAFALLIAVYIPLVIYSYAIYVFDLLTEVNAALFDMALRSRRAFVLVLMAVDIRLYRAGDIHLHQVCISSADGG